MIIEFFGPPSAGKTTLCHALDARLRQQGVQVEFALSSRPAEGSGFSAKSGPGGLAMGHAARRIAGPVLELLMAGRDMFGKSTEAVMTADLLKLLPPNGVLWSLRLRRYIWRRAQSWNNGRRAGRIVIFDQAFIQVIYSLAALSGRVDEGRLVQALDVVPMPDLLVRLVAPPETLTARLIDRRRGQGAIERLLEVDPQANLRSIGIIDVLHDLLRQRGQAMISVRSADRQGLDEAVRLLAEAVIDHLGSVEAAA